MPRPPSIMVAVLIALAIVTLWWQLAERRARHSERDLAEARRRAAVADSVAASLRASPGDRGTCDRLQRDEIEHLEQSGLGDPLSRLREDLARHPELIPYQGVSGGTMFFDTSSVLLMPPGWAYAWFEDGHIGGHGLFEYRLEPGGRIAWRRIAAKLE